MTDTPDSSPDSQTYEGYVIDAENAAEMARLMLLDRSLTQAMGGPLPEQDDLSHIFQVLDIACGPGGWLLDMATQYPHIQAVGIDISQIMIDYATHQAKSQELANIQFRVMDATQPLAFPDNSFDLVNGRILLGFLSTQQWSSLLAECHRIIKPGGILRLTEAEWGITNSVALDQFMEINAQALYRAGHSFSARGRTFGTTAVLRLLLQEAGFEVVGHRTYEVNYSAGTVIHDSCTQNILVLGKMLEPLFIYTQLTTQEKLETLMKQVGEEMQAEKFCAIDYYLTVRGRKPKL
jgi:ubiquinone/menaquinone biosynthesis C-methylase UbiE